VEELEFRFAGEHRVHAPQEPVKIEAVVSFGPGFELGLHLFTGLGPVGADFGEGQVALGEFGAAAVDPIEDVYDDIEGLVGSGDFFDVQVDIRDAKEPRQTAYVVAHSGGKGGIGGQAGDERAQSACTLLHQFRHIDPERIVSHLDRLVKGEDLVFQVKT